jgi:TetR/AcrR family transcriptional regulator
MPKDTFHNLLDEKRDRIMLIAVEEFAENTYHAASISKIVRKAGIAKGSFYQYFEDKKAFYRYLVEMATEEKLNIVQQLPAPDPSSGLFDYMRWQFLAQVVFELQRPHLAKILYRAFIEEIPFPDITEELRRRGTTQFFKQLFSQGILHGKVAPWVDPDVAGFLTEVIFYQFGKYFIERLKLTKEDFLDETFFDRQDAQALLSNLMDIIEAGMKREPDQLDNFLNQT